MKRPKEEILKENAELEALYAEAAAQDPFYGYEPSDGTVSEAGMELLREFLKEEDIPQVFDSQKDVHMCEAEIIGVSGGNRSSKSCTGTVEDLIQATGELPISMESWYPKSKLPTKFPQRLRAIGVSEDQLGNAVLPEYRKWVPRSFLKDGSWSKSYESGNNRLVLGKNNKEYATIEFKTNRQDVETHQGNPLDKLTCDEEPSSAIYQENLMRFATAEKLRIQIDWTPTKGLTYMTDMFHDGEDRIGNTTDFFELCPILNPAIKLDTLRSIYRELQKECDYDVLKRRILGKAVSLYGLIYGGLFSPKIHVVSPDLLYKDGKISSEDYLVYRGGDVHQVTAARFVEIAVDKFGYKYIVGCCEIADDTDGMKGILAQRAEERDYRLGQTKVDKSCDSNIAALGGINIFKLLQRGANAIPALVTSDKYFGSISAGVDQIKQDLKIDEKTGVPVLTILDLPENKPLIQSFRTLEREHYANEDVKGEKDRIQEGKHHYHAALRYAYQSTLNWFPPVQDVPEYEPANENIGY